MGFFDDLATKVQGALEEAKVQHILVKTESEAVTIRKVKTATPTPRRPREVWKGVPQSLHRRTGNV
jgi:hypothetical protein